MSARTLGNTGFKKRGHFHWKCLSHRWPQWVHGTAWLVHILQNTVGTAERSLPAPLQGKNPEDAKRRWLNEAKGERTDERGKEKSEAGRGKSMNFFRVFSRKIETNGESVHVSTPPI